MPGSEPRPLIEQLPPALRDDLAALPDGRLLERFLRHHDEPAFELLLRRHRAMVFGVCRRILRHAHDAEDAFQAVFLVLLRSGSRLVHKASLGGWLHGVARNAARKARGLAARRAGREAEAIVEPAAPVVGDPLEASESLRLLDDELARLPAAQREAVVLCELQGVPLREAAAQLGVPVGTLSGRLTAARRRLAERLAARGIDGPAALARAALPVSAPAFAPATVPEAANEIATEVLAMFWARRLQTAVLALVASLTLGTLATCAAVALVGRPTPPASLPPQPVALEELPVPVVPEEKPEFPETRLDVRTAAVHPTGVPLLLDVKLTNLGRHEFTYWCGGPGRYPGFNNTSVAVADAQGRVAMHHLSNGQFIQGSGIQGKVPSCAAIDVPALIGSLPPGKYTLRIGSGDVARVEVKDDAGLVRQWEAALLQRVRAGEPFAMHVARTHPRPAVMAALLADLSDAPAAVAVQACYTLWLIDTMPAGSAAAVAKALARRIEQREDEQVRRHDLIANLAILAGKTRSDDLIEPLVRAAKADIGEERRARMVDALGEFPQAKARAEVLKFLADGGPLVRFSAAGALARRKDRAALPLLLEVAGEVGHPKRTQAVYLLRHFRDDPAVEGLLRRALNDPDAAIAAEARRSLE